MPAAAVKREEQVLFELTGRKGCVGCISSSKKSLNFMFTKNY